MKGGGVEGQFCNARIFYNQAQMSSQGPRPQKVSLKLISTLEYQALNRFTRFAYHSVLVSIILIAGAQCRAQNSSRFTLQGPADKGSSGPILDSLGRPCLDIEAAAKAHVVNPQMIDHIISIKNNCPSSIKVSICYFRSDRCVNSAVQGYKRLDTILGTMSGVRTFRYSVDQRKN